MEQHSELRPDGYGKVKDSIEFWQGSRCTIEELYPSERIFFDEIIKSSRSFLDVGCAAGGFGKIIRRQIPDAKYTGIDISKDLIQVARQNGLSGCDFLEFDGVTIPLKTSFDSVFSFGVLHHAAEPIKLISEMMRVSAGSVLFDLRLTHGPELTDSKIHYQRIAFAENSTSNVTIPYYVYNWSKFLSELDRINDDRFKTKIYSYKIMPTTLASLPKKEIYTATFLLERR